MNAKTAAKSLPQRERGFCRKCHCLRQIAFASEIDRYFVDPGAAFPGVVGPEAEVVFREFVGAHSVSVEDLEPDIADLFGAESVFLAGEIGNAVVF